MQDFSERARVLFLQVVAEALREATDAAHPKLQKQAVWWLLYDFEDYPNICELAGLEPSYLRRLLENRLASRA